jgi:hypothetical protein
VHGCRALVRLASRALAAGPLAIRAEEPLGTVSFAVSGRRAVPAAMGRGVALPHDFRYAEARPSCARILAADPDCVMAHRRRALSGFHQIWDRPDAAGMATGWRELAAALARSARERADVAALAAEADAALDYFARRVESTADGAHPTRAEARDATTVAGAGHSAREAT